MFPRISNGFALIRRMRARPLARQRWRLVVRRSPL